MLTWDEIKYTIRTIRRWWWIIALAVVVSAGTAFYVSASETRYYSARATILIGNAFSVTDQYEIQSSQSLARFYGELIHRERILKPVQEQLQLPFSWQTIAEDMLRINIVPDANLIEIFITDSNPDRATAIANAIGATLVGYSPTSPEEIKAQQQLFEQQVQASQSRIQQLVARIDDLTAIKQTTTSPSALTETTQRLAELNNNLGQEQAFFSALLSAKKNSNVNSLSIFETATPTALPLPSKRPLTVAIAGLAGFLLALVAVFILEQLDRRRWYTRDLDTRFKLDHLGQVPIGPPMLMATQPFVDDRLSAAHDAQTNILLAGSQHTRILMITSPEPSEARATFAIDLADLFSRSGHKVLLIDAEFTRAFLTRFLDAQSASEPRPMISEHRHISWAHLQPTALPNVTLLPGDVACTAPTLMPSQRWRELLENVRDTADFIIFDGPAALRGPDAALLAPHVDGIVLALDPATDSPEQIVTSVKRLQHHKGARVLGAVTLTPSTIQLRDTSFWRQLYGRLSLALPLANAARTANRTDATTALDIQGPMITPIAADAQAEDRLSEPHALFGAAYDSGDEAATIGVSKGTPRARVKSRQILAIRPKRDAQRTLRPPRRAPR